MTRYIFGFMCVCALGVVPLVGCGETEGTGGSGGDAGTGGMAGAGGVAGTGGSAGDGGSGGSAGSGGMPECLMGCDDGEECTEEVCADGMCSYTAVANNTECNFDGLPGLCTSGICEDAMFCADCNDGNLCTEDVCYPVLGICDYVPVDCDDGNECTDDACDAADGCSNLEVENGTVCGDGLGTCQEGSCVGGIFACSEEGIRAAIAVGGGPHTFDCGGPMTVVTDAEIVIDNDVILDGEGNLTVDGNESHRVFSVAEGVTAALIGFTVTGGATTENGGGIYNDRGGILTLTNSTVSGNTATGVSGVGDVGGGIFNDGRLTLTNSTVSGNSAHGGGGGIFNVGFASLTDSTASENTATRNGGGIFNNRTMRLTNSTVSSNDGFGIANLGVATLINSTISGNSEGSLELDCVWIDLLCGRFDLINSTVSGDIACEGVACGQTPGFGALTNTVIDGVCGDTWASNGYNIESPGNTCGFDPDGTDKFDVTPEELNLGPLADNGGATMTHALLTEPTVSVAIDQIPGADCVDADGAPLTTDQRGKPRPETGGTMCDVGAFEVQP